MTRMFNSKGGTSPRRSGDRVERIIAKDLGEQRTVGSGAFKFSNKNLTGDIDVHDNEGREFVKLEVKASGTINTKGERSYNLTTKVLDQMQDEAESAHELGALILYFKNGRTYTIMPYEHWKELLELAKLGRTMLQ